MTDNNPFERIGDQSPNTTDPEEYRNHPFSDPPDVPGADLPTTVSRGLDLTDPTDDDDRTVGELEAHQAALDAVRDMLSAANSVPITALDDQKFERITTIADECRALEKELANEIDQKRGLDDAE